MTGSRFLRACHGEQVDRTPIWLMRQAGRYLPEYRDIRKRHTMLEAISTPELAAEITLQPLRRFPLDAAILFSDLTIPFTPMGAPFELKEGVGPVIHKPVRSADDLGRLHSIEPHEDLGFTQEAIRILKRELAVPLIGFTGAPFTLASYLIEGGPSKDLKRTRALMYSDPTTWNGLMELLAQTAGRYLAAQMEAGADAVQLFDSWVGALSPGAYARHVQPFVRMVFEQLKGFEKPLIHFGTGNPALLPLMANTGCTVLGVDWRTSLSQAGASLNRSLALQGNLDPALLLAGGPELKVAANRIVEEGRRLPGHIFNLGHGIYPETPLEHVEELMSLVCEVASAA